MVEPATKVLAPQPQPEFIPLSGIEALVRATYPYDDEWVDLLGIRVWPNSWTVHQYVVMDSAHIEIRNSVLALRRKQ